MQSDLSSDGACSGVVKDLSDFCLSTGSRHTLGKNYGQVNTNQVSTSQTSQLFQKSRVISIDLTFTCHRKDQKTSFSPSFKIPIFLRVIVNNAVWGAFCSFFLPADRILVTFRSVRKSGLKVKSMLGA